MSFLQIPPYIPDDMNFFDKILDFAVKRLRIAGFL